MRYRGKGGLQRVGSRTKRVAYQIFGAMDSSGRLEGYAEHMRVAFASLQNFFTSPYIDPTDPKRLNQLYSRIDVFIKTTNKYLFELENTGYGIRDTEHEMYGIYLDLKEQGAETMFGTFQEMWPREVVIEDLAESDIGVFA